MATASSEDKINSDGYEGVVTLPQRLFIVQASKLFSFVSGVTSYQESLIDSLVKLVNDAYSLAAGDLYHQVTDSQGAQNAYKRTTREDIIDLTERDLLVLAVKINREDEGTDWQ